MLSENQDLFLEQILGGFDSRSLELIIFPTEKCNFRCAYCYEDFQIGRMKPETVESIKRLITERSADLGHLHISWFGGEPLMAADIIFGINQHAKNLSGKGMAFTSSITTNGYLIDRAGVDKLLDCGVRHFQISLDGLESQHNSARVLVNGQGTFEKIWSNLELLRRSPGFFECVIRVHLQRKSYFETEGLLRNIAQAFGNDRRFQVFLKGIKRFGGPRDAEIEVDSCEDLKPLIEKWRKSFGASLRITGEDDIENTICYAARYNSFVVRANGRLGKCTVALSDPDNDIGYLDDFGRFHIVRQKLSFWTNALHDGNPVYLGCPLAQKSPSH